MKDVSRESAFEGPPAAARSCQEPPGAARAHEKHVFFSNRKRPWFSQEPPEAARRGGSATPPDPPQQVTSLRLAIFWKEGKTHFFWGGSRGGGLASDQTKPSPTRPDQTRPDQTPKDFILTLFWPERASYKSCEALDPPKCRF